MRSLEGGAIWGSKIGEGQYGEISVWGRGAIWGGLGICSEYGQVKGVGTMWAVVFLITIFLDNIVVINVPPPIPDFFFATGGCSDE